MLPTISTGNVASALAGEYEVANIGLVEKKRYFRKLLRECEEENYQIRKKFEPETNPKRKWIFA